MEFDVVSCACIHSGLFNVSKSFTHLEDLAHTKITNLYSAFAAYKKVLRLDISVHNILHQSWAQLITYPFPTFPSPFQNSNHSRASQEWMDESERQFERFSFAVLYISVEICQSIHNVLKISPSNSRADSSRRPGAFEYPSTLHIL